MDQATPEFTIELAEHLPAMRAFAAGLSGSRVEGDELVQEASLRALTHHDKYMPGTNMRAWLLTIIRNCFYSQHRRQRRFVDRPDDSLDPAVEPDQEWRIRHGELLAALDELPSYHREALLLVVVHDLSYEEAALALDCSIGTIKSRVFRARTMLADALDTERPRLRQTRSSAEHAAL
ncbi:sigma-70 family RNA polymerase sigma factor [Caulobacter segnis]|uniref:sigma-70 family RNA polymerase sigma factor n=1 Tax=Caulobacter segnis TaxID=88688 RepID=UPI00240ED63B|nr:sigma-70 family RNA polymerase sigma factor [Caulobacter segnis]MDG2520641.1 sigma-70 family RNA polymerase sigma factor [Caulobacter segnis]